MFLFTDACNTLLSVVLFTCMAVLKTQWLPVLMGNDLGMTMSQADNGLCITCSIDMYVIFFSAWLGKQSIYLYSASAFISNKCTAYKMKNLFECSPFV